MEETSTEEITKVVFRRFEGDIIALFPEIAATLDPCHCQSYMHLGQHGAADYYKVLTSSKPVTDQEAGSLKEELEGLGYKLTIYKRSPVDAYQKRVACIADYLKSAAN